MPTCPKTAGDGAIYSSSRLLVVVVCSVFGLCGVPAGARSADLRPHQPSLTAPGADGDWIALPPPPAHSFPGIAYDSLRDRLIFYGSQHRGVWVFPFPEPSQWTSLCPAGSPPPPALEQSVIYDPRRDRLIVFGGSDSSGVWALSLSGMPRWDPIVLSGASPGPRFAHTAIYDPIRHRMIVFGGRGSSGERFNDVWALSLADAPEWTPLPTDGTPPSGRFYHSAIYDSRRDRMVVFGGTAGSACGFADLFELSLSEPSVWNRFPTDLFPTAGNSAIYDPVRDRVILYGGFGCACEQKSGCRPVPLTLTHGLSLETLALTQIAATGPTPPPHPFHNALYDPVRDRMVVFGENDLWALSFADETSWNPISPADLGRFVSNAAIHDPVRERMIVSAGDGTSRVLALDLTRDQPALQDLEPSGVPPPDLLWQSAIYDPVGDRMLVFGGYNYNAGSFSNDVWALSLSDGPTWTLLEPSGARPSPRARHSAIYDPIGHRMLIFGGGESGRNDTWSLSLSGTLAWQELQTYGFDRPGPRLHHSAIYDPVRRRMIVYGGAQPCCDPPHTETFALSLDTHVWSRMSPTGPIPQGHSSHTAIYDPLRDRMVIFSAGDDTWALSLAGDGVWAQLFPSCSGPIPRSGHTAVYDPRHDRMVTYSGFDLWLLNWHVVTPTHASLVWVEAEPGRVRLQWFVERGQFRAVEAYRARQHEPWQAIGAPSCDGQSYCSIDDREVESGQSYGYRLRFSGTEDIWTPEVWALIPSLSLAIEGGRPVIVTDDMIVTVSLEDSSPGKLELFDTMGRRVLSTRLEGMASGRHPVRLENSAFLPPGLYHLRLQQAGRSTVARALRLR